MHYKNGRQANEGDPVLLKDYTGKVITGTMHSLNPGSESCNASVAVVVPGGVNQFTCVTVGQCFYAEDAFNAIEADILPPPVADALPVAEEQSAQ